MTDQVSGKETIEYRYSVAKSMVLAIILFLAAFLFIWFANINYSKTHSIGLNVVACGLVAIFGIVAGTIPLRRAFFDRTVVLTLSPQGIHDRRLTTAPIPWSVIKVISSVENTMLLNIGLFSAGKCVILGIEKEDAEKISWCKNITSGKIMDGFIRMKFEKDFYGIAMSQMPLSCRKLNDYCADYIKNN
jgi:hypothetical protein